MRSLAAFLLTHVIAPLGALADKTVCALVNVLSEDD